MIGIAIASIPSSRTGKDTAAAGLHAIDTRFAKLSLAEPIKNLLSMTFRRNFHDDKVKTQFRELLQVYGTDIVRDKIDMDAWIQTAIARTALFRDYGSIPVITDLRAENEVERLRDIGYFMVLLAPGEEVARGRGYVPDGHAIENQLNENMGWHLIIKGDVPVEQIVNGIYEQFQRAR